MPSPEIGDRRDEASLGGLLGDFYRKGHHIEIYSSRLELAIVTDGIITQLLDLDEYVRWSCNALHDGTEGVNCQ